MTPGAPRTTWKLVEVGEDNPWGSVVWPPWNSAEVGEDKPGGAQRRDTGQCMAGRLAKRVAVARQGHVERSRVLRGVGELRGWGWWCAAAQWTGRGQRRRECKEEEVWRRWDGWCVCREEGWGRRCHHGPDSPCASWSSSTWASRCRQDRAPRAGSEQKTPTR